MNGLTTQRACTAYKRLTEKLINVQREYVAQFYNIIWGDNNDCENKCDFEWLHNNTIIFQSYYAFSFDEIVAALDWYYGTLDGIAQTIAEQQDYNQRFAENVLGWFEFATKHYELFSTSDGFPTLAQWLQGAKYNTEKLLALNDMNEKLDKEITKAKHQMSYE